MANGGNHDKPAEKNHKPSEKADHKRNKPPRRPPLEDEDFEDGDIATPKRDRYGTDDEPL
jgi:hypothetical protein